MIIPAFYFLFIIQLYYFQVFELTFVYCKAYQRTLLMKSIFPGSSRIDMQTTERFVIQDLKYMRMSCYK